MLRVLKGFTFGLCLVVLIGLSVVLGVLVGENLKSKDTTIEGMRAEIRSLQKTQKRVDELMFGEIK